MFVRKAFWLILYVHIFVVIESGYFDNVDSDENQTPPNGKADYGVDMVRLQHFAEDF